VLLVDNVDGFTTGKGCCYLWRVVKSL